MDENKPRNIFEAAGSSKPKKSSATSSPPSSSQPKKVEETLSTSSMELLSLHKDPDINLMLNKMNQMHEDIQSKLTQIYDENGVSTKQVKNFLDNPNNFPPELWQKIQSQRDGLEAKIETVLKSYAKKKQKGIIGMDLKSEGLSKERKSKTLGARKNWIPM